MEDEIISTGDQQRCDLPERRFLPPPRELPFIGFVSFPIVRFPICGGTACRIVYIGNLPDQQSLHLRTVVKKIGHSCEHPFQSGTLSAFQGFVAEQIVHPIINRADVTVENLFQRSELPQHDIGIRFGFAGYIHQCDMGKILFLENPADSRQNIGLHLFIGSTAAERPLR